MPSEVIIIVIELMFLGVNMFLALLRTHFCSKMSLSRAKNKFTPANSIVITASNIAWQDMSSTVNVKQANRP